MATEQRVIQTGQLPKTLNHRGNVRFTHLNALHQFLLEVVVAAVDGVSNGTAREDRVVLEFTVRPTCFYFRQNRQ